MAFWEIALLILLLPLLAAAAFIFIVIVLSAYLAIKNATERALIRNMERKK